MASLIAMPRERRRERRRRRWSRQRQRRQRQRGHAIAPGKCLRCRDAARNAIMSAQNAEWELCCVLADHGTSCVLFASNPMVQRLNSSQIGTCAWLRRRSQNGRDEGRPDRIWGFEQLRAVHCSCRVLWSHLPIIYSTCS